MRVRRRTGCRNAHPDFRSDLLLDVQDYNRRHPRNSGFVVDKFQFQTSWFAENHGSRQGWSEIDSKLGRQVSMWFLMPATFEPCFPSMFRIYHHFEDNKKITDVSRRIILLSHYQFGGLLDVKAEETDFVGLRFEFVRDESMISKPVDGYTERKLMLLLCPYVARANTARSVNMHWKLKFEIPGLYCVAAQVT